MPANVATWGFELGAPPIANGSVLANLIPDAGAGTGSAFHVVGATNYTAPPGNGSLRSSGSNHWSVGDYYQFQVNLASFGPNNDVTVAASLAGVGTAPKDFKLQYSTNGANFTDFQNCSVAPTAPWIPNPHNGVSDFTFDLGTSVSAVLLGNPTVFFRLTDRTTNAIAGGLVAPTAPLWLDDVKIDVNQVVTVNQPSDQANFDGDVVALPVVATDLVGNPLTYAAINLPPGLTIDSITGLIHGVIAPNAHVNGPYSVTVTAIDNVANLIDSKTFNWAISQPTVTLTSPGNQSGFDGDTVSLTVAAADTASHYLTYTATGLPIGLSINSSTGVISGIIASDADASGPFSVTVTATDGSANVGDSHTFSWEVTQPTVMVVYSSDGFQGISDGQFLLYRANPAGALTVNYVLAQCANEDDPNSTDTNGQATFADGAYYAEVDIPSSAVSSNGADENYTLQIVAGPGDAYQTAELSGASITIHAQARVWIDSVQSAVEGESSGYFRLKRASTDGEMTVCYLLDSGTGGAVEGVDFAPLPDSVTFADGQQYADVVIDPTGQYANANMEGDKTVVIQLTGLDATETPADPGAVVILEPAVPAPPAPVFAQPSYTFYAGEGMPGANQELKKPWGWIGQVSAPGTVTYSISPTGNEDGYFQVRDSDGWISPRRTLPRTGATTFHLTVTATNRGGSTTIPVTIHLVPWVYVTGDLQGVKAPFGIVGNRDRIRLDFVRVASAAELQTGLTIFYEVNWSPNGDPNVPGVSFAATIPAQDLQNPTALVAANATNASLTFAAGQGVIYIVLTPSQMTLTTGMKKFQVSLDSVYPDYAVMEQDVRLSNERDWGQSTVICTILPRTTLFASNNTNAGLRDADGDGGVNINDISQGWIGDCYFLADVAAIAWTNPAAIRNMITDLGGGSYRVTFTNLGTRQQETRDVTINLTYGVSQAWIRGDYTEDAGVKSYEIWPQILEKAYSIYMGRARFVDNGVGATVGDTTYGGTVSTMIRLTGRESTDEDMKALDANALGAYLARLVQDVNDHKPVVVYNTSHAYALLGYDDALGGFAVYNPNGDYEVYTREEFIEKFQWAITQ